VRLCSLFREKSGTPSARFARVQEFYSHSQSGNKRQGLVPVDDRAEMAKFVLENVEKNGHHKER